MTVPVFDECGERRSAPVSQADGLAAGARWAGYAVQYVIARGSRARCRHRPPCMTLPVLGVGVKSYAPEGEAVGCARTATPFKAALGVAGDVTTVKDEPDQRSMSGAT